MVNSPDNLRIAFVFSGVAIGCRFACYCRRDSEGFRGRFWITGGKRRSTGQLSFERAHRDLHEDRFKPRFPGNIKGEDPAGHR